MQHTDLLVCDTDAQVPMELVLHCLMMCLVMRLLLLLQIGESSCVCDVQWPRNWHSSLHLLLPSQQCCSCPPAALVRLSRHQNAGKTLQCQSTSLTYIAGNSKKQCAARHACPRYWINIRDIKIRAHCSMLSPGKHRSFTITSSQTV